MQVKMKRSSLVLIVAGVLFVGAGVLKADTITVIDDFTRADANNLGSSWDYPNSFSISSNNALGTQLGGHVSVYKGIDVGADNFEVYGYMSYGGSGTGATEGTVGVAFNVQDANNYYAVRYIAANSIQIIKCVDGAISTWSVSGGTAEKGPNFRLIVRYDSSADQYTIIGGLPQYTYKATDTTFSGQGGGLGLYSIGGPTTPGTVYKFGATGNEAVPEPASMALLAVGGLALLGRHARSRR